MVEIGYRKSEAMGSTSSSTENRNCFSFPFPQDSGNIKEDGEGLWEPEMGQTQSHALM